MWKFTNLRMLMLTSVAVTAIATGAFARNFHIPAGDLKAALDDVSVEYRRGDAVR